MLNPAQEDAAADARNEELEKIAETFAKVKEFLEADEFTLWELPPNNMVTPTRRSALSSWKNYYKATYYRDSTQPLISVRL